MPRYLFQAAYTADSWATQVKNQPDPIDRVRPLVEACGGRIEEFFYCFGDYDIVLITDMPDDQSAAAVSLAAAAGGSLRSAQTTKLLTVEQGLEAMRKAEEAGKAYTPPVGAGVPRQASKAKATAGRR
jgi:uncharacterized protein with GYD domain